MAKSKKENKYLNGLTFNFWQKSSTEIDFTIKNPYTGKKLIINSIEHNKKHDGEDRARTHNNLFRDLKAILIENDKWDFDLEEKERKRRKLSNKFKPIEIDKKYGYIYLTTNKINGMKYIGQSTRWDDNYIGSGTLLKEAIKEFGKENFKCEVQSYAYTYEQLNDLERMYIKTFNAVKDPNFYNLAPGGDAYWKQDCGVQLLEVNNVKMK